MSSKLATSGRKASITKEDIIAAALALVGPNRSVSSLSLREVARQANIAPNSFYRHFKDVDELAITLIEHAGESLRGIIGQARKRILSEKSAVRCSVESFFEQLDQDKFFLPILLREGTVGSDAFQHAVKVQLQYFEQELQYDLEKYNQVTDAKKIKFPALTAKAITRLVFTMGADAITMTKDQEEQLIDNVVVMVKMILRGSQ